MLNNKNNFKKYTTDTNEACVHQFRLNLLIALLFILSSILILRLAYLQFDQYKRYATLSLKNQMSITPIAPSRGIIVDRFGIILAKNIPVYVLEIIPERVKNLQLTLESLQQLIPSITNEDLDNFKKSKRQNRSYIPIPLKLKLTQEEVATFASNQYLFPGVSVKARLMRFYPLGEKMAHLIGYVGRLNIKDLQTVNSVNYQATNFIGKTGIEKFYENELHGAVGFQQVETDVSGRTLRTISKQNPTSGNKLALTIDARLQQNAFDALGDKRGAIVIMDVTNGEILAMASSPSFDPNLLVNGMSSNQYLKMSNSSNKPLYNRAVRGLYPPGSTVKPYIAIAGLDKNIITPNTKIYDPGSFSLPGVSHKYRDWKHTGHGIISLKRALTVSCNTYFYQLANRMGIHPIEDILSQFGFGQLTHIDLTEEVSGVLPGPDWKLNTKGTYWYPGDTLITSIGQGYMLSTPIQLASSVASLSQNGRRFKPHLLKESINSNNKKVTINSIEEYPVQLKHKENWGIVKDAMRNVITSKEGTGYKYWHNAPYTIAAKTGTAQVYSGSLYEKKAYDVIPENLRDHSLFIGYAPLDKPKIAIAVIIENHWSASLIARKVTDAYFNLTKNS